MAIDFNLAGSVYIVPTFRKELPAVACPAGLLSHPREERAGLHSKQGWLMAMQHLQSSCPLLPCASWRRQWPACRREGEPAPPPVGSRSTFLKMCFIMSWGYFAAPKHSFLEKQGFCRAPALLFQDPQSCRWHPLPPKSCEQ